MDSKLYGRAKVGRHSLVLVLRGREALRLWTCAVLGPPKARLIVRLLDFTYRSELQTVGGAVQSHHRQTRYKIEKGWKGQLPPDAHHRAAVKSPPQFRLPCRLGIRNSDQSTLPVLSATHGQLLSFASLSFPYHVVHLLFAVLRRVTCWLRSLRLMCSRDATFAPQRRPFLVDAFHDFGGPRS